MLYLTPVFAMLYLTPIIVMLYLIPIFDMLHLTRDVLHRHSVFTPVLSIYTDTWHITLDILFMTPALGIHTDTRYISVVVRLALAEPWNIRSATTISTLSLFPLPDEKGSKHHRLYNNAKSWM